jgi:hypothetical protein
MDDTIADIPGRGGRMLSRLAVLVLFSLAGSVAGVVASSQNCAIRRRMWSSRSRGVSQS